MPRARTNQALETKASESIVLVLLLAFLAYLANYRFGSMLEVATTLVLPDFAGLAHNDVS